MDPKFYGSQWYPPPREPSTQQERIRTGVFRVAIAGALLIAFAIAAAATSSGESDSGEGGPRLLALLGLAAAFIVFVVFASRLAVDISRSRKHRRKNPGQDRSP